MRAAAASFVSRGPTRARAARHEMEIFIRRLFIRSGFVIRRERGNYCANTRRTVGPASVMMAPSEKPPAVAADPADNSRRPDDGPTPSNSATPVRFPRVQRGDPAMRRDVLPQISFDAARPHPTSDLPPSRSPAECGYHRERPARARAREPRAPHDRAVPFRALRGRRVRGDDGTPAG